jgi:YegS/Rv2252/BmrU family lipid kinase
VSWRTDSLAARSGVRRAQWIMPLVAFVINRTLVRDPHGFTRRCRAVAQAGGWEPRFAGTTASDNGLELARRAVADGARLVFAAGGDGTVRACAQALAGTGIPLAIVPLGTANLTARALGIPARVDRALEAGLCGRDRHIDLACVEGEDADPSRAGGLGPDDHGADRAGKDDGNSCGTSFVAMAGIGLDAAVVDAARGAGKRRLGWVAYAVSGLAHLRMRPTEFTIRLDGGKPMSRRARCVVVGNAGLLPGGFVLLPEARLDDGLLDVGILAPTGALGWPRVAGLVLARSRHQDAGLERFQARRAEISADTDLPRQIDGEMAAPGRALAVSVRPGVLTVRQAP